MTLAKIICTPLKTLRSLKNSVLVISIFYRLTKVGRYFYIQNQKGRINMNFGQAIEEAKRGKKIARKGWNGKGQYVELATNVSYKSPNGTVTNVNHKDMGNKALAFVGTSGVQLGWLASQADMLSEDWQTID